jgi:hypothetical protein
MSRAAKLTLMGTSLFALSTVVFVHYTQKAEQVVRFRPSSVSQHRRCSSSSTPSPPSPRLQQHNSHCNLTTPIPNSDITHPQPNNPKLTLTPPFSTKKQTTNITSHKRPCTKA